MRAALEQAAQAWSADRRGRRRLAVLRALGDAVVPAVTPPRGAPPLDGFWALRPSDVRAELAAAGWIETRLSPLERDGLCRLLDLLGGGGFDKLPVAARERLLRAAPATSLLGQGLAGLRALTLGVFYGLPGDGDTNPTWSALGYPGPPPVDPPAHRQRLRAATPPEGELHAEVCVVGSGSGGGVVAAVLAQAGLDVVVLEAGGHHQEHDFPAHELQAFRDLYWRGGFTPSADGHIVMAAGATLGGGSTVNWTNCVLPPARVRTQWADDHGLKDVDTPAFDEHVAAVAARIGTSADSSDANGPNQRLRDGADALGWSWVTALRNADPSTYDPATAGHMGFGDRSGSKRSGLNTWLLDAELAGARLLVHTKALRVMTALGNATGVEATTSEGRRVVVHAPTVVVACGALETPALLLRSGIGGPAAGKHLRLHPSTGLLGFYAADQQAWWGPPHSTIVDQFADLSDGYGFLVEGLHYGPAYVASSIPWHGGRDHKVLMGASRRMASLIGLVRDRGSGTVTLDAAGEASVGYPLDDPLDLRHLHRATAVLAQIHRAAGATAILDTAAARRNLWRRGENLGRFLLVASGVPYRLPHRVVGSAHQMGSARMGRDRQTSAADPEGRLHDTGGVWIGDTSAFPTSTGANPMVTCMALARRTATAILAARS